MRMTTSKKAKLINKTDKRTLTNELRLQIHYIKLKLMSKGDYSIKFDNSPKKII